MMERVLINRLEKGVVEVRLNRPDKHNALDLAMFKAIKQTINALKRDRYCRVIIVTGAGEDFCSGLDVKSTLTSPFAALKLLAKWLPGSANLAQFVSTGWRTIPCPVIFAIQGRCWGGGLQIALGGDIRIAHPDSSWAIMEAKWGLIPDMGGFIPFRELMRKDQLMELAYIGDCVTGTKAQQFGLVSHLAEDPFQAALALADKLLQASPDALAANKKLANQLWQSSHRQILWRETFYQMRVILGMNQAIAVKRATNRADKPAFKARQFK